LPKKYFNKIVKLIERKKWETNMVCL
jgi:hypothetical protein